MRKVIPTRSEIASMMIQGRAQLIAIHFHRIAQVDNELDLFFSQFFPPDAKYFPVIERENILSVARNQKCEHANAVTQSRMPNQASKPSSGVGPKIH